MCGWAGVFGRMPDPSALAAAAETIATRGPDGQGAHRADGHLPFGVAHRRLSIIDPGPGGAQPMRDPDRDVTLVYNGELYNSPQLREELRGHGHRFRSDSDTEVLLRAWIEWGDAVLERLEGIFSFAIVDQRRGRALLARDRVGVKPLYWATATDGAVIAGSAPRALLALEPGLGVELDEIAIAQFLTLLWIPHPRTPWRHIAKLPPGHAVTIENGEVQTWQWWHPPPPALGPIDPGDLQGVLTEATQRQLLSDVPVGLLFSGGLDSTLLLALMAKHYGDGELYACTAGYDSRAQRLEIVPDDARYAREVAESMPQVDLAEVVIDADPLVELDRSAWHFDDPVADPAAITLRLLCEARRSKVLLSGVGGEELFAGYPRHAALALERRAAGLPAPVRAAARTAAGALWGGRAGPAHGPRRNAAKLARTVGDPGPPHYWRTMAQLGLDEVAALVPGAAVRAFDELDAQSAPLAEATLADALAFDRAQFLPNLNLAYVDKASMAAGVEVRVPLLDEMMLDAVLPADPTGFIVDGVTKQPLKQAARGLVPDAIIDRPKSGFGGPARSWFRGPGASALAERIDAAADAGLVTRGPARRLHRAAASGRLDAALAAWALVCLQAWSAAHHRP